MFITYTRDTTAPAVTFPPLPRFPPKRLFGGNSLGVIKERSRLFGAWLGAVVSRVYVDEHLYNIQCSEIFTLRNEKLHTEA